MKSIERLLFVLIVILGVASAYVFSSSRHKNNLASDAFMNDQLQESMVEKRKDFQPNPGNFVVQANDPSARPAKILPIAEKLKQPLSEIEVASVNYYVDTFLALHGDRISPQALQKNLDRAGLAPKEYVNSNDSTGKMVIVRADGTIPGTRYLHAQFFEDGEGGYIAQHISFEIRPSPNSEEIAMDAIQRAFGGVGDPTYSSEGFKEWKTKNCKTIWLKVAKTKEDLEDDVFNAHSYPADLGMTTVAMEDDPHCHESPIANYAD